MNGKNVTIWVLIGIIVVGFIVAASTNTNLRKELETQTSNANFHKEESQKLQDALSEANDEIEEAASGIENAKSEMGNDYDSLANSVDDIIVPDKVDDPTAF